MKNKTLLGSLIIGIIALALSSGCSSSFWSMTPAVNDVTAATEGDSNTDIVQKQSFAAAKNLITQLKADYRNHRLSVPVDSTTAVVVTTVVDINKLDSHEADPYGREVSELIASELSKTFRVTELRLDRSILLVPDTGEFALTRVVANLPATTKSPSIIIAGTYMATDSATSFHLKALDPASGVILASADFTVPFNVVTE